MPAQIKIENTITLLESNPPASQKLVSNVDLIDCNNREFGYKEILANSTNVDLLNNISYVYISSTAVLEFQLIDHSTSNVIATISTKNLTYQNKDQTIDIKVSNPNSTAASIRYVAATIAEV